jgi:hypothetical protein
VQNLAEYWPLERKFLNHLTSGDSRVAVQHLRCFTAIAGVKFFGAPFV